MTPHLHTTTIRRRTAVAVTAMAVLTLTACAGPAPQPSRPQAALATASASASASATTQSGSAAEKLNALAAAITTQPGDVKDPKIYRYSYLRAQSWDRATNMMARTDATWWRAIDGTGRADTRRLPERRDLTRMPTAAEQRRLAAAPPATDRYPDRGRIVGILTEPIPADQATLTARLFEHQPADTGPQALLWAIGELARYHYLNQQVRATTLRILAGIHGLRYTGDGRDIAGRRGLQFLLDSAGNRDTILLDPRTGQLLAHTQTVATTPPALFSEVVYLTADRVAHPGDLPTPTTALSTAADTR